MGKNVVYGKVHLSVCKIPDQSFLLLRRKGITKKYLHIYTCTLIDFSPFKYYFVINCKTFQLCSNYAGLHISAILGFRPTKIGIYDSSIDKYVQNEELGRCHPQQCVYALLHNTKIG